MICEHKSQLLNTWHEANDEAAKIADALYLKHAGIEFLRMQKQCKDADAKAATAKKAYRDHLVDHGCLIATS